MKRLLLLMLVLVSGFQGFSQTKGISYQAVILSPQAQEIPGEDVQDNPLPNTAISIQFIIVNESGREEYKEEHNTRTDRFGMINLVIGTGRKISSNGFSGILWSGTTKKLKVGIDFSAGSNFSPLGEQNLTYMPSPASTEVTVGMAEITTAIAAEVLRSGAAQAVSDAAILVEKERAISAEQKNAAAIVVEKTRAEARELVLTQNLAAEITTARAAELANATGIIAEIKRSRAAEEETAAAIIAETAIARAAEVANATAIIAETKRAGLIEQANAKAIIDEATTARAAEAKNAAAITVASTTARDAAAANTTAIKAEAARAINVEAINADAIKAEAERALKAERVNADAIATKANIASPKFTGTVEVAAMKITGGTVAAGKVLTSDANGMATWQPVSAIVREVADEFLANEEGDPGLANVNFALNHNPSRSHTVKMYINGVRISNRAYSNLGPTIQYEAMNNGGYDISKGDRVQFDYFTEDEFVNEDQVR